MKSGQFLLVANVRYCSIKNEIILQTVFLKIKFLCDIFSIKLYEEFFFADERFDLS